jgi:hypothetical protein
MSECPKCTKAFKQNGKRLRDHIAICSSDAQSPRIKCPDCTKTYATHANLARYSKTHQPGYVHAQKEKRETKTKNDANDVPTAVLDDVELTEVVISIMSGTFNRRRVKH